MRYYSSIAPLMTLQSGVTSGSTTFTVDTVTGLPGTFPFSVVIDAGVSGEEVCSVTNVAGLVLTVTRGQDGTTATSHSTGALIRHMATARDYQEPQTHMNSSTGVHGATGAVVGTTDAQTLTNKNISGSTNTLTNIPGANVTGTVPQGSLPATSVSTTGSQTLTNKTITTPLGLVKGDVGLGNVDNTSDATKNAASVTLTNKTISGASNTLTNIGNSSLSSGIDAAKVTSVAASFVAKTALPVDTVYGTDSGLLTGVGAITMASNWTDSGCKLRIRNGVAMLTVRATRTTSAITASVSNGNIADTSVLTIAVAWSAYYPADDVTGAFDYGASGNPTVGGICRLSTTGIFTVAQCAVGTDININDVVRAYFTWMV